MSILLRGCLTKLGASQCVPLLLAPNPMSNAPLVQHEQHRCFAASLRSSSHDEASLIRQRIPKAMSAQCVFLKETFDEVKNRSDGDKTHMIFRQVVENFKQLSPFDLEKYAKKAEATQKAHHRAISALTKDEKAVLLVDYRKRVLRRKILAANKELIALKSQLEYPGGSANAYLYFAKDRHELLAEERTVSEKGRALGRMWQSADEKTRQHYTLLAQKHAQEARQRQTVWRQKLLSQPGSRASLARFDELRSLIRRAKLKLDKLERFESIDEAANASAPKRKTEKKATPARKRVVKKKAKSPGVVAKKVGAKKRRTTSVAKRKKSTTTAKKTTGKK